MILFKELPVFWLLSLKGIKILGTNEWHFDKLENLAITF